MGKTAEETGKMDVHTVIILKSTSCYEKEIVLRRYILEDVQAP